MDKLPQFSLDEHLKNWRRDRQSVRVDGSLQEDGEFYVICLEDSLTALLSFAFRSPPCFLPTQQGSSSPTERNYSYTTLALQKGCQ